MNGLTLAAGVAATALAFSPVTGAVLTIGGPLSRSCYQSALERDDGGPAIESCTRALEEEGLSPGDKAATYVNRGILLMMRRSDVQADDDFNSAIQLDERLPDAWLNKGFLRVRQGNGREALPFLQKGIDRGARREALAIFARGVAYEQMGELRAAYRDLTKAHEMEPGWALPIQYLASYRVVRR